MLRVESLTIRGFENTIKSNEDSQQYSSSTVKKKIQNLALGFARVVSGYLKFPQLTSIVAWKSPLKFSVMFFVCLAIRLLQ